MVLTPAKDSIDVGLLVEDIKKSLAFYQGTLGLEKIEEVQMSFGKFYRLRYGTSDVKLLDSKTIPPEDPLGLRLQPGTRSWTLLTFEVRNLSSVCRGLKDKGVEFFIPETQIRPGARIAGLKDPDGNLIELIERG
jgi:catechol 2,3-dioxygenase-like lactoylglutathione lyase family enzyme